MTEDDPSNRQHQSGLRKSKLELMQKIFEDAPLFMAITEGPNHRIKFINAAFRRLLGNRAFQPGIPANEVLPEIKGRDEEQVKSSLQRLNRIYATGEPLIVNEFETYLDRTGDGTLEKGYFNFFYNPLKDENVDVYGLCLAGYEVTEHVQARQESLQHEQRLNIALEGAQVGFWEFDIKNHVVDIMSDQCKALFGCPPAEVFTNKDFLKVIHPEDRDYIKSMVEQAIEGSQLYEAEYRVYWPDGSLHWLMSRGQCTYDEQDRPDRLVGITVDVTQHKQAEQKLKEAIRLRDDFLSIASHELQTPVTSMKAQAELFERQLRDAGDQAYAEQAEKISNHIGQLSRLTAKLLDMSRMQQKGLALEKKTFSLGELIEETVESLSHLSHHDIEVHGKVQNPVFADRSRIGQVLTNLLENAIKYSSEADRVAVRYREKAGKVIVSVVDFGIGISKEDRLKVFERFFKGKGSKQTYPGFGIGLYISRRIIERHEGGMWVEDNPEGGSVFSFSLPLADKGNT